MLSFSDVSGYYTRRRYTRVAGILAGGIEIHAKAVTIREHPVKGRVNGTKPGHRGGGYKGEANARLLSGNEAVAIRKFHGMSAFCPYDYVATEVNPYPGRIIGREVKSIAGNRDWAVERGEGVKERRDTKGNSLRTKTEEKEEEERSRVKITRRDTPRRRNSNEPRD